MKLTANATFRRTLAELLKSEFEAVERPRHRQSRMLVGLLHRARQLQCRCLQLAACSCTPVQLNIVEFRATAYAVLRSRAFEKRHGHAQADHQIRIGLIDIDRTSRTSQCAFSAGSPARTFYPLTALSWGRNTTLLMRSLAALPPARYQGIYEFGL